MFFQIIQPAPTLRPYISRYVYVRAEGSTDTMAPPEDDPRFVNGKHVQPLLPNYGSFIFVRNSVVEIGNKQSDELMLLGANQKTLGLTTLSGWFEGMLMDFEPGGMHVLTGMDLQQLSGKDSAGRGHNNAVGCFLFRPPSPQRGCELCENSQSRSGL